MASTVKEGILEGIWQKSGHLLVLAVSAIVCGYAILIVGSIKTDILIEAANASDATIRAVVDTHSENTYAQTEMIRIDLSKLRVQQNNRVQEVNSANKNLQDKIEANRLEAKQDTIRLESKLTELQSVLIDEIRKY